MQHGSVICRVTFSQAQAKSQIFPRRGDVWIRLAGSTRSCCSSTTRRLLTAPKSGHSKKTQTLQCWPEGSNLGWKQCSQILVFWRKIILGFWMSPPQNMARVQPWEVSHSAVQRGGGQSRDALGLIFGIIPKLFGLKGQGEVCGCWKPWMGTQGSSTPPRPSL